MPSLAPELAPIFPRTADVAADGHLIIGGCDAVELARDFGTPLYVFDETELRETVRAYREAFASRYEKSSVVYASKAYLGRWIASVMAEERLGMDVVSGGELAVAKAAGFPLERVFFHGNNKGEQELREAVEAGVGRVVIDNFQEIEMLDEIAGAAGRPQPSLVRVSPGVDPHTHAKTTTGTTDVKFGFSIETGAADEAVALALRKPNIELLGLHFHLGSPIFELEPFRQANDVVMSFAKRMQVEHGFEMREYNSGGGFAAQYVRDKPPPTVDQYAHAVVDSLREALEREELLEPLLFVEPGRPLVARAAVALYTVGARKELTGIRTYVSVDGGMGDNVRPAMYDARYEAVVANRVNHEVSERVTVAGKYCESGDVLIRDVDLPKLEAADVLALPAAGAYCIPMSSNYNMSLRPAIVSVLRGRATLLRRRETYQDLLATDVWGE
jgi:diaminopimelate decarboxylase